MPFFFFKNFLNQISHNSNYVGKKILRAGYILSIFWEQDAGACPKRKQEKEPSRPPSGGMCGGRERGAPGNETEGPGEQNPSNMGI